MKRRAAVILGHEDGRYFIDVASGLCKSGCLYCYVQNHQQESINYIEFSDLLDYLISDPNFMPGEQGTLLLIGAHSDLFSTSELSLAAIHLVKSLAPLGNPIQLSTKSFIKEEWTRELSIYQVHNSQLIVFVSCSTILQWEKYEPNTASPQTRLQTINNLNKVSILNCLLIKPFLPSVTNKEVELLIDTCNSHSPKAVCVGSFYLNHSIAANLNLISNNYHDVKLYSHPLMDNCFGVIHPPEDFILKLLDGLVDIPIFKSTPCVIAYLQQRYCPIFVWKKYPKLCVQCQDCDSLYNSFTKSKTELITY